LRSFSPPFGSAGAAGLDVAKAPPELCLLHAPINREPKEDVGVTRQPKLLVAFVVDWTVKR